LGVVLGERLSPEARVLSAGRKVKKAPWPARFFMGFRFLDDVAIADVAFQAWGNTPEELFEACGRAVSEIMVDTSKLQRWIEREISLEAEDLEHLLFDFLSEIIYLKDAEALLLRDYVVRIRGNSVYRLAARMSGEEIDPGRHELRMDVKGVTYHLFRVGRVNDHYEAQVVVDV